MPGKAAREALERLLLAYDQVWEAFTALNPS